MDQAYGNCPQYIQQRVLEATQPPRHAVPDRSMRTGDALTPERSSAGRRHVPARHHRTPTAATTPPIAAVRAGFVRVEADHTLWWPDYPGNNMFNSLGNLAVDPTAALLFLDFTTGRTLHLSGQAVLEPSTWGRRATTASPGAWSASPRTSSPRDRPLRSAPTTSSRTRATRRGAD